MKHMALVALLATVVGQPDGVAARQLPTDQSKSRHLALLPDTAIFSVLLPDDEFVVIERDRRGSIVDVAGHATDLDEDMNGRARFADVIAVGEVINSASRLVYDDTWIETDVTIDVRQLVKDTEPPSLQQSGASITFNQSGGELLIGRVRVRADHYFLFKAGERYLVFIRQIQRNNEIIRAGLIDFPFRITSEGRLAPMTMSTGTPTKAPSPLYGLDLETVIAELQARIRRQ